MVSPCKIQWLDFVALQHQSVPGTLKSSVLIALAQSLVLQAPCQCHVPLAQQTVHCAVSHLSWHGWFHLPSVGGLTLGMNSTVPLLSGCLTSEELVLICIATSSVPWCCRVRAFKHMSQQCTAGCTLWWNHTLANSGLLGCWLESCMFSVFFLLKEDNFCMTLGSATGWLTGCCWCCCASVSLTTNHRPHNGCQIFYVTGFTTPCIGVAHALGLRWWIEHKDTIDDVAYVYIYLGGSGYDPWKLLQYMTIEKEALQWIKTGSEHDNKQWWTMAINSKIFTAYKVWNQFNI